MALDQQSDMRDCNRMSGTPSFDQKIVTNSATLTITAPKIPFGFQVIADAVVTWISLAGTTNTSVSLAAGSVVPGYMTSITVASGTILVHFW